MHSMSGRVESTGCVTFRQALASPHSASFHRFGAAQQNGSRFGVENATTRTRENTIPLRGFVPSWLHFVGTERERADVMRYIKPFIGIAALLVVTSGCALSLRNPNIADLQRHPGRYQDRTVSVSGIVTSSWGLPLVPFRLYKVDDGTGEVTVLSQGLRMPAKGEHVRVKGRVGDVAVLGGRPLGLHIREQDLYVKRD